MQQHKCEDCGFKGTTDDIYSYGWIRLCAECIKRRETNDAEFSYTEMRDCTIQDTKLAIIKQLRTWQVQGLYLASAIQKLEATLD